MRQRITSVEVLLAAFASARRTTGRSDLTEDRSRLICLAEALVRAETLDQWQAYAAAGLTPPEAATGPAESAPAVSRAT